MFWNFTISINLFVNLYGCFDPCQSQPHEGLPHLHTQLQDGSRLTFSYICFSYFTFPGATYQIFLVTSLAFSPFLLCRHRTTTTTNALSACIRSFIFIDSC